MRMGGRPATSAHTGAGEPVEVYGAVIVRPSEVRYKPIARALKSGSELARSSHNQLLSWPNQTKIESLQKSGGTSHSARAGVRRERMWPG